MNRIEVCFSPGEYHLYEQTLTLWSFWMCSGPPPPFAPPWNTAWGKSSLWRRWSEARAYKDQGHIVAAERGGQIVEGLTWAILPTATWTPS